MIWFGLLREFYVQSEGPQNLSLVTLVLKLKSKNLASLDSACPKIGTKWNSFKFSLYCKLEFVKHCLAMTFLGLQKLDSWLKMVNFGGFCDSATRRKTKVRIKISNILKVLWKKFVKRDQFNDSPSIGIVQEDPGEVFSEVQTLKHSFWRKIGASRWNLAAKTNWQAWAWVVKTRKRIIKWFKSKSLSYWWKYERNPLWKFDQIFGVNCVKSLS